MYGHTCQGTHMGAGGQPVAQFSPSNFVTVAGIKLRCQDCLGSVYPLSYLTNPLWPFLRQGPDLQLATACTLAS